MLRRTSPWPWRSLTRNGCTLHSTGGKESPGLPYFCTGHDGRLGEAWDTEHLITAGKGGNCYVHCASNAAGARLLLSQLRQPDIVH